MMSYLIGPGSAPNAQGQAAYVKSRPSAAMLSEISEAVKDARLVGWDLSDVPNIELSAIQQIDDLARRCNTLVVVVEAQPHLVRELSMRPLSHVVIG
jgi:hypothetical protein